MHISCIDWLHCITLAHIIDCEKEEADRPLERCDIIMPYGLYAARNINNTHHLSFAIEMGRNRLVSEGCALTAERGLTG